MGMECYYYSEDDSKVLRAHDIMVILTGTNFDFHSL